MNIKHTLILAIIAAASLSIADWTYDGTYITEAVDGGTAWKLKTTSSGDHLTVTAVSTVGTSTEIDFSTPIRRGDDNYVIVGFGEAAMKSKTTIVKITLPDTLKTLGKQAFYGCSDLRTITPFLPSSLTSVGYNAFGACSNLAGDLRIESDTAVTLVGSTANASGTFYNNAALTSATLGKGVSAIPRGMFYGCSALTNVVVGADVTSIGTAAFAYCGALVNVRFEGDKPSSIDGSAFVSNGRAALTSRIIFPDNKASWNGLSLTECTPDDADLYASTFGNDGTCLVGKGKPWSGNVQFFASFPPAAAGEHSLSVTSIPEGLGSPVPGFGENILSDASLPHSCTADEYVEENGVRYRCVGSTLETYVDEKWVPGAVTNSYGTFMYQGGEATSHRLVWLYEVAGYKSSVSVPDGIGSVTVGAEPDASGFYAPGTAVTYSAVDGDGDAGGEFVRWYGDVDEALASNRVISVTIDSVKSIRPYFRRQWVYSNESSQYSISDGYWRLKVDKPGATVTLAIAAVYGGDFDELDLAKGEANGYPIISVSGTSAFMNKTRLRTLTLPAEFTSVADKGFMGCGNLSTILPKALPDTVTHLGYNAFSSCGLSGSVEWRGATSYGVNGSGGGSQFQSCEKITSFVLGRGISVVPAYFCDGCSGLEEFKLHGQVTAVGNRSFRNCTALSEVVLPASMTVLDEAAFAYCSAVKTLVFKSKPSIGNQCFTGWTAFQAQVYVDTFDTAWQSVVEDGDQVKKWGDCTDAEKKSYTDLHSGRPIGILKSMVNGKAQWLCRTMNSTLLWLK